MMMIMTMIVTITTMIIVTITMMVMIKSLRHKMLPFLAVQDSSIGDLVTHSVSESVSESCFDFSDFREDCRAVVDN